MRILFSPVGDSDPIRNFHDGSMLHIVRHFHPDAIYLYLSAEMQAKQDADERYTRAIDYLAGEQWGSAPPSVELICRPGLVEAHQYDQYYADFRQILMDIRHAHPDAQLILNVSSGTPAMKSALTVLNAFDEFSMACVQVASPEGASNAGVSHEGADVREQWETDLDNEPDAPDRCQELESPHLESLWVRNKVKQHVQAYDYVAALREVNETSNALDPVVVHCLEACVERQKMNTAQARAQSKVVAKVMGPDCEETRVSEYIQLLGLKLKREEYADFVRAMTPAVTELLILVLEHKGKHVRDILSYDGDGSLRVRPEKIRDWWAKVWDQRKVGRSDLNGAKAPFVTNHYLFDLVRRSYGQSDRELAFATRLYGFEQSESLRNRMAHTISKLTLDDIRTMTGIGPYDVLNDMRQLFDLCAQSKAQWDSYDRINAWIIAQLAK